jgi:hypothetical protein
LIRVLTRRIDFLESGGPSRELFVTVAGLAQAEDNTGAFEKAREHWRQAENLANQIGDNSAKLEIRSESLIREALVTNSPSSIEALIGMRTELINAGEKWMAAKIALDLSAIFIRIGRKGCRRGGRICHPGIRFAWRHLW